MKVSILILLALLMGCESKSLEKQKTNNQKYEVDFLFEHDGCKIYRFYDRGSSRYFVKCANGDSKTISTHTTGGKSKTIHNDDIPTGTGQ